MSWQLLPIKELGKVVTGKTPSRAKSEYFGGTIPFITPSELDSNVTVTSSPQTVTEKGAQQVNLIPKNSIMVCCIGSIGKIAIAGVELTTNQQINSIVFDENKIFPKYGYYACSGLKKELVARASSTTVAIINKSRFEELNIPVPPLTEQKRIAAILDKADAIRRKRTETIHLLNEFQKSLFLDMFGDPVKNEKGWDIKKLEEITTKITDGVHQKPNYTENGTPFISVRNITNGYLDFDDCKFISNSDHEKFTKRCKPEKNDILYTKVGATYGRPAIVDTDREFSIYVSVALIKPDKNKIDPLFLKEVLGNPAIKNQADQAIKGVGVPDLHLIEIKKFLIPCPPRDIQRKFVEISQKIQKQKDNVSKILDTKNNLFQSLTHRAFKGEL